MSNIAITFKYENKIIRDPLDVGTYQSLGESEWLPFLVTHNSNKSILDCGIFISPYENFYAGTNSSKFDYNKVLWFADNFPGYGLFVKQNFIVYGEVYRQDSKRLIDVSRVETKDIFAGSEIEMLSGFSQGEKRKIVSYDPINNLFALDNDFSAALETDRYKIVLETEHVFKSQQGSSQEYPIPLLYNAGTINRFEEAQVSLRLKVPPFIKEAGKHFFNLNIKYTPEE
jgi:hypothetical protein